MKKFTLYFIALSVIATVIIVFSTQNTPEIHPNWHAVNADFKNWKSYLLGNIH